MSKDAMKLALEALETELAVDWTNNEEFNSSAEQMCDAIKALKEALAKQEQGEPVAWVDIDEKGAMSSLRYWSEPDNRHEVALYTKDKNT
jgi:aspartate/methionine/tyrosine aminotransferase